MTLKEKIQKNLLDALKAQEELKTSVLRLLSAAVINKEKEKRFRMKKTEDTPLTDEEILDLIFSEVKKRREAAELYEKGSRPELAEKETKEMEILKSYLPDQLSEEELKALVNEAIKKSGAKEPKDMGKVMGILAPQIKGRAEGGAVSKIVKEILNG